MAPPFYEKTGSLISPGDLLASLPYVRVPKPLQVARKYRYSLPAKYKVQGDLREILEVGTHVADPEFDFEPHGEGEDVLSRAKVSAAIFLTWGSEVEDDERRGNLQRKDWLIAPVFSLAGLEERVPETRTGETVLLGDVIRQGMSPRYFPLRSLPGEESAGYYVDFRKICPLAATYFQGVERQWRLAPAALNDFYHQLLWFLTRRRIFFGPVKCGHCGGEVDLNVVFEGQPIEPENFR